MQTPPSTDPDILVQLVMLVIILTGWAWTAWAYTRLTRAHEKLVETNRTLSLAFANPDAVIRLEQQRQQAQRRQQQPVEAKLSPHARRKVARWLAEQYRREEQRKAAAGAPRRGEPFRYRSIADADIIGAANAEESKVPPPQQETKEAP